MAYAFRTVLVDNRLNKSRTIVAASQLEFQRKVNIQRRQWEEQWQKIYSRQQGLEYAQIATNEAEEIQNAIDNILLDSLNADAFDFDNLKDYSSFDISLPSEPEYLEELREPLRSDEIYNPKPGLLTKMFSMDKYNAQHDEVFNADHNKWLQDNQVIINENNNRKNAYKAAVQQWNDDKAAFEDNQIKHNNSVDDLKDAFYRSDVNAIEECIGILLDDTNIPIEFDTAYDVHYVTDNRTVIVDALFPTIENMPKLKAVTYVKSRQELKESYYSEAQLKKKYDDATYKLVLSHLNKIFSINSMNDLIDNVVLNGIVNTIDKTTGNKIQPCILTIRISRESFENLNLYALDPKAWFRSAKGIAAANIASVTPVTPIQTINKEDKRFIDGYDVIEGLNEGENLAAIDWQDFENLVREVFGQEFSSNGGEVKITQASRDGGVDAIAFDPDPIRGGKIVIQAKRYTNVVGVSAVRDLYGTIMNEGAMKGILVTTSYYGNDAYDFATGKPIQLIDGAGLLALLEKHGHKARIDLKEAKQILNS